MSRTPIELPVWHFRAHDGTRLAYRQLGEGRPIVLIHGFFSTSIDTWVRSGCAARIASLGYRVILPDMRGHGESARPHDAASYPPDVLTDDGLSLLAQLGLDDYDLGGYSLGARVALRMQVRGATPGRALVGGTGLEPIVHAGGRGGLFRRVLTSPGTFRARSPEAATEAYLQSIGGDPVALLHVLDTPVDTAVEDLARIATPTVVITGVNDRDHGSPAALAETLSSATCVTVPGNHITATSRPEFAGAITTFLGPAQAAAG